MNLLKKIFELWAKTNWLKTIAKERRKLDRLEDKTRRQQYVVKELCKEYLKRFPQEVNDKCSK